MNNLQSTGAASGVDSFDHAESLLACYPDLTQMQIDELKHWWRKDASALEIASLASKVHLQENYRSFRADHIDGLRSSDVFLGLLFMLVVAGVILAFSIMS